MISQKRLTDSTPISHWPVWLPSVPVPIRSVSLSVWITLALCSLVLTVRLHGVLCLVPLMMASLSGLSWRSAQSRRCRRRSRSLPRWLPLISWILLWLLVLFALPAQAQFFGNAENWMQTTLGANTGDAIPLVFNVLRGLFLLYVGISLVRVINSARNDEDWQTIARTPLIIIIAVTAGDILTTLITG